MFGIVAFCATALTAVKIEAQLDCAMMVGVGGCIAPPIKDDFRKCCVPKNRYRSYVISQISTSMCK